MMTIEQLPDYIYESPDGGETVYARKIGTSEKILIFKSDKIKLHERWLNLKPIVEVAEYDISINDLLSKLEMLYVIKKKEG